jgi:hypothetical protein
MDGKTKLLALSERLLQATLAGKIAWEPSLDRDVFITFLPSYGLTISGSPSPLSLSVRDDNGRVVDSLTALDVETTRVLLPLFEAARRKAQKADQAIDVVAAELAKIA